MIVHIRYINTQYDMYIDCIGIGELESDSSIKINGILYIGENDNYLNNREITKTLNSMDYFFIDKSELIESEKLEYYKNMYPEFCL